MTATEAEAGWKRLGEEINKNIAAAVEPLVQRTLAVVEKLLPKCRRCEQAVELDAEGRCVPCAARLPYWPVDELTPLPSVSFGEMTAEHVRNEIIDDAITEAA